MPIEANTQKALINGAGRGLGKALCEILLAEGFVVFAGLSNIKHHQLDGLKTKYGDKLVMLAMDITDERQVKEAAAVVSSVVDGLDVMINNAGLFFGFENYDDPLKAMDFAKLEASMQVNVYGGMRVVKHFAPLLYNGSGTGKTPYLINITSEAGSMANTAGCYDSYSITKVLMNIVSHKMRTLLENRDGNKVQVLAVHPGRMKTDMSGFSGDIIPETAALGIADIVMGRTHVNAEDWFINYDGSKMVF